MDRVVIQNQRRYDCKNIICVYDTESSTSSFGRDDIVDFWRICVTTHISARRELESSLESSFSSFPFLDLKAQFAEIRDELVDAVTGILESQHFILGPEVEALEREVAEYVGAEFAIGCGSGSDALLLAQMALGIEPGDEIITSPFTFGATAGSIARLKARPVFVDIHPETFNMDERQLEATITPRSRAIMPVHLFGLPANMDVVLGIARKRRLAVIEDAAQAIGARWKQRSVGSLGTLTCFEFLSVQESGWGGGWWNGYKQMIRSVARRLRILRVHGTSKKYHYDLLGINSRIDALQAAILRVKLRHLNKWTEQRRRNAERYHELFVKYRLAQRLTLPSAPDDSLHVYNQYSIRAPKRDECKDICVIMEFQPRSTIQALSM